MRYIGSKILLLDKISSFIPKNTNILCDIFAGTASVGKYFKKSHNLISNDILYFSFILQKAYLGLYEEPKFSKFIAKFNAHPIDYFNKIACSNEFLNKPFIYENYSPSNNCQRSYFSVENALKIDYIRQSIEQFLQDKIINQNEYYYLLASLIEAVSLVSNTTGTYGAYLKIWDKRSLKPLTLSRLDIDFCKKTDHLCFNENSSSLIDRIAGDVLYIDPPYNSRQYAPNYHILETIARYDYPKISGVTGVRDYANLKSNFCIKAKAKIELENLVSKADFKHIILSYNSEGIISETEIQNILKKYGKKSTYKCEKIPYRRYKSNKEAKNDVCELLFYIEK
ncbi:ulcer associated adenine specific DNA methyltransferase [Campylobacter concisus UNSW3]|jgi:modification methylase fokI|uniref:site-specific DNA-methyltransferase (adenine-specific) n=2 Tax=Campylobacter concisus TaxID=199 RepID=U2EV54_9BACT|nr:DNA adenine methylase [Campylobacter concisus]ERJ21862.1 ulcer associated adenine specific DNA methyltransferase [Campylobacter concisus UNSW3]